MKPPNYAYTLKEKFSTPMESTTKSSNASTSYKGHDGTNRKLYSLRHNLPACRQGSSVESLSISSQVELKKTPAALFIGRSFIPNEIFSWKQDQIAHSDTHDFGNLQAGHHQCCCTSMCSSCVYIHNSSLIETAQKLNLKDKRHQAKRHCRPTFNGAPFVICSQCFELLRLPIDFSVSKRRPNKLRCGACSKTLALQFPAKGAAASINLADSNHSIQMPESSYYAGNELPKAKSFSRARNCGEELNPPLHKLMGYVSATEVLYQSANVDEGYESSEPAMPDSYRCYEEERHKNIAWQYSEDEAYFGSVEVEEEEDDSTMVLRKREQLPLHSLMNNGVKRYRERK